ncbi:MAG: tetratricopeptide repeat protein [Gemmatimonadaceae bacterium]|nr:tetratricopeptide repeat protein [Gemmatimonadaceae bacterium]
MTILPPSAEDVLSPLRAQVDDLARELTADESGADNGVVLKQRIFLLHRAVEQHAQLLEQLQGDVRRLVDAWKGRFSANATSSLTPLGTPTISPQPRPAAPPAPSADPTRSALATPATASVAELTVADELHGHADVARGGGPHPAAGQPRVIDELNASTFVERGWSRIATGDYVGAEQALEKALALNPGDAHAETLLGWAQMSQGKFDSAMALFEQVLDRVPDHALAHINVGYVYLRRRQFDTAMQHLARAIELDSDRKATLYAHYYLGLVHFELQQYAEAIGSLLRAIELGPNLIEARFELGRVFWFADRTDDAIAAWRKGAEVNKFNPWSARCRDMLATIADGGAPSRVA